MDLYSTVFELIDMRSFSNLWFWIALAVLWSSASHYVIGVPYDLIQRARRKGGQAQEDVEALARIYSSRMLYVAETAGIWLLGFVCFLLTTLGILGFAYWVEFAQALFLLALPMTALGILTLRTARRIMTDEERGEVLNKRLLRHRVATQGFGMVSIFVTAMWGMYWNMTVGVLGG